jgi:UDP-N-acetylglucosamine diphosphorylase/glucosamine-1-phosphate N-acetyltransferase
MVENSGEQLERDILIELGHGSYGVLDAPGDVLVRGAAQIKVAGPVNCGPGATLDAENGTIILGEEVELGAGAILNAQSGSIWLDRKVKVEPGAIIQGPAYIGPESVIRAGAQISGGVCFVPHCRVGGEVSSSIIQGYSSKQHAGYLGNSCLGSWVNLGAATDTSDLKNNYRPVTVSFGGRPINTGRLHVGATIGDFSRTAIHTRLASGTVIGTCCHLLTADFPPGELPPFTWAGPNGPSEYRFDKAMETIAAIMPRRGRQLTAGLAEVLRKIFERTRNERSNFSA